MTVFDQDPLQQAIVKRLEQAQAELDADTLSRLCQSRQQALAQLAIQHSWQRASWGGFALAGLCALTVYLGYGVLNKTESDTGLMGESELLLDDQSLDFYEDLDFYLWLDAQVEIADEV